MRKKDMVSHDFMADNEHFADAINFIIGDGRIIVRPDDLTDMDVTEGIVIRNGEKIFASKKIRDVAKRAIIKQDSKASYVIVGIENQSEIHYAMPVRNMLYDALDYSSQVNAKAKENRMNNKTHGSAEFLSGFCKKDKLKPVITLVINWSKGRWDGPTRLSDMMEDTDPLIQKHINDYKILLIDPHQIEAFGGFKSSLGDVLEFIKRQNDKDYLREMIAQKGSDWKLELEAVNVINTFTGARIPTNDVKEGQVINMCEATRALIDEGRDEARKELEPIIEEKDATIADKDAAIADRDAVIADKDAVIADKDATIAKLQAELEALKAIKQ